MSKLKLFLTVLTLSAINVYGQSGSWRGELNLGQVKLPLIFNFTENVSGDIVSLILHSPLPTARQ